MMAPGGMYMKQMLKNLVFSLAMGMVIPYLFLSFGVTLLNRYRAQLQPEIPILKEQKEQSTVSLPVRLHTAADSVTDMDMDEYLVGVLLAEMPAFFEIESLKAQSVVARTYARKAYVTGGKHGDGGICTESSCCQGYRPVEAYLTEGGTLENVEKIRSAVLATSGYVLTYGDDLIEATYFSCSGGRTEAAVAVWGTDFPYLQAVNSPGEEHAAYYTDVKTMSEQEFADALNISSPMLGETVYTEGGGIHTMVIGGKTFTGTDLRARLGLRSTAISITRQDSRIRIETRGYGHRVGMSQYGADAMANEGSDWQEILAHYYTGVTITILS